MNTYGSTTDGYRPTYVSIMLTLEESGWLCHLLSKHFIECAKNNSENVPTFLKGINEVTLERQHRLHEKLMHANDQLMGK